MSFRLIQVQTGIVSEHNLHNCPPYLAVSHAWSENLFPCDVTFLQSPGRKGILRVIEEDFPSVCMCWIDTICILQHDETDKHRQIPLMGRIFGGAIVVVVLLTCEIGLDQATVDDFSAKLKGAIDMHEAETWAENGLHWQNGDNRMNIIQGMRGLAQLTKTAWATRVWTLQEYILAQRVVWVGSDLIPIKVQEILFSALPDVCDTLDINECFGGEFEKLFSHFSGMAISRLGKTDETRVMELLGNRRATVGVDEVYGVMAASGVQIPIVSGETKEKAWELWVEEAIKQGNIRWLLMPEALVISHIGEKATSVNCIVPASHVRHKVSSGSALDFVKALGAVDVQMGTAIVPGRWIGSCQLITRLGMVHEPTPNRIHRDITLVLFSKGQWQRAHQVASAFGAGRYNRPQLNWIARTLMDNYGRAMKAVRLGRENDFRPRFREIRQLQLWSDFMEFQMGQMPGMNDGVAYLASVRRENLAMTVVVVLGQYLPGKELDVIDIGGRTGGQRCIFMLVERPPPQQEAGCAASSSAFHRVAVTLPVTGEYDTLVEKLPVQLFRIGGNACVICSSRVSLEPQPQEMVPMDTFADRDTGIHRRAMLERLSDKLHARRLRIQGQLQVGRRLTMSTPQNYRRLKLKDARLRTCLNGLKHQAPARSRPHPSGLRGK